MMKYLVDIINKYGSTTIEVYLPLNLSEGTKIIIIKRMDEIKVLE